MKEIIKANNSPILKIEGLKKYYPVKKNIISRKSEDLKAVDGIDLSIYKGETLGLIGESGCGKSTMGRSLVKLEQVTEGRIWFEGKDITNYSQAQMLKIRTELQMIFQDTFSSLNPKKRVYDILSEPLKVHKIVPRGNLSKEVKRLLESVGLSDNYKDRFPHELSGGQRQRIGIAKALSVKPKLIICDEPVSALDVSIQAQILNLMKDLQSEFNLTYLFIGHGLGVIKYISDRVAIMYLGKIVEVARTEELFKNPKHPYTKALLDAAPTSRSQFKERERIILKGDIPSPINIPKGCRFHTRCPFRDDVCVNIEPKLTGEGHLVACLRSDYID